MATLTASSTTSEFSSNKPIPAVLCSNCGSYCPVASGLELGDQNQRRIAELESQVNILKKKAAEAGILFFHLLKIKHVLKIF
jgi:hypothetical protein